MKKASILRFSLLSAALCLVLLTGCSKKSDTAANSDSSNNTNSANSANNANNVANAMSQAMGAATAGGAHKSAAHSVPSATLASFLPNLSGFTAHEPSTSSANFNGIEWSTAERQFDNGDKHVKVTLADYNYAAGLTAAYTMLMNYSMEDENQIQHGEKFGNYPGWVTWHKKSNDGEIGVIVADRIYLMIEGSGGVSLDDLRAIVGQVNLDGVAKAAS
ncbi:MAG TPA: hypothetical protein VFH95_07270 [Candidatus Kapabacteria bacterium]|nr:hypothetical protein [Candidatus Kapabacteria bacterium]